MARRLLFAHAPGLLALVALATGCAAKATALEPSALPKKPVAAPAKPKPPKENLMAALRGVERPAPVLDLFSRPALQVLDTRLQSLSAEQRQELVAGDLAETMPLLHLKAGGSSGIALFALATTSAAARELPQSFELMGRVADEDRQRLVKLARDVAQRAALHFLRDRVLDVATAPAKDLPALLAAIERAAIAADRPNIVRLSLETWAASGAPADVMARLGAACAFDQDEKCFAPVLAGVRELAPEHARLVQLDKSLKSRNDGDPIVKGWSLLQLGRYADARRALAPVEGAAKSDLRVAAGIAVAVAEGSACPGLPLQVGSPRLCADAFKSRPGLSAALADLSAAWQARGGRDAASVEAYLGLVHVVPWVTELAIATDAASLERNFEERGQALARVLGELPEQKPLAVFASALAAGVKAGLHVPKGERPRLDAGQRQELWFGALGVDAPAPRLAVSALLASEQSVLQLIPQGAPGPLVPARAGLLAWEAAANAESSLLANARGALADQVSLAPKGSTDGAAAVLLLAELDAVATPNDATHNALAQVASQLIGQPLPPELALRAVLDAAGALERLGKSADALTILTRASEIASLPGQASDLLTLIRAERLVLEWNSRKDPERKELAKALAALSTGEPPPTIAFVIGAWASPKILRQPKQKLAPKAQLADRIGVRAAESMAKGVLRGTRVSLRVAYAFQTGVAPEVTFDPMLVPLVRPDLIQKAL
jgi:hypothetical protein